MLTCKYCANLKKCIRDAYHKDFEHNEHFEGEEFCPYYGFKRNTNADRIRAMSDEELCDFLGEYKFCDICVEGCDNCTYHGDCDKRLLDWLKQPAEE